jgi:hypothetical protein
VKPGGTLVVLASCEDGIGSQSFLQWFEHEDAAFMREALLKNYAMNGGTALALKMKTDNCPIHLYTSLGHDVVQKMGLRPMRDIRQDLAKIIERGTVRLAAVLPEGAITVAKPE